MLPVSLQKNDKAARWLIFTSSIIVFTIIVVLGWVKLDVSPGFDKHIFARINAVINSLVSVLLIAGLVAVKQRKYALHKQIMILAIILSCLFLVSYICHHLITESTKFGEQGPVRYVYYLLLGTHILLAGVILPFILFTAYRGLTGEWSKHRKLAKITWPVWLYVSVTGVVVYLMISPYY
jgi:putative membrane protein